MKKRVFCVCVNVQTTNGSKKSEVGNFYQKERERKREREREKDRAEICFQGEVVHLDTSKQQLSTYFAIRFLYYDRFPLYFGNDKNSSF